MRVQISRLQPKQIVIVGVIAPLIILLFLASLFTWVTRPAHGFTGAGSGTVSNPYLISDCVELQSIIEDIPDDQTEGKIYKLAGDIDCSASAGWNAGEGFEPIGNGGDGFKGVLDGAGYTISDLTINRPTEDYVGLLGHGNSGTIVANITLDNINIVGQGRVGGIAGHFAGKAIGVTVQGSVTGASQNTAAGVGGVFGNHQNTDFDSYGLEFRGSVTNTGPATGGISGSGGNGRFRDFLVDATINGTTYVGGAVGLMNGCCGLIQDGYAIGTVTGTVDVGGIVGSYFDAGSQLIQNVFAANDVNGTTRAGGVIGSVINNYGAINNANLYFDETAAGIANCYGTSSVTVNCTAQNGDGLSADYFYDSANEPLASWDFTDRWAESAGNYPLAVPVDPLSGTDLPTGLTVEEGTTLEQISLSWTAPISTGTFSLDGYYVQGIEVGGSWSTPYFETFTGSTSTTFDDIRPSTDFIFRIRAQTAYGASDWVTSSTFTSADPSVYSITTCEELEAVDDIAASVDTINLVNDVDCSGITSFEPLFAGVSNGFKGTFDGNGFTIRNLTIDQEDSAGLFNRVTNGTLRNVNFDGGSITVLYDAAGVLANRTYNTVISDISSNVPVTAMEYGEVGGIVAVYEVNEDNGIGSYGIERIESTGSVSGSYSVGGLIGKIRAYGDVSVTLRESYASGNVDHDYEDGYEAHGGLVGEIDINANDQDQDVSVVLEDVYASGDVDGEYNAGGLVGVINSTNYAYANSTAAVTIQRSYASGNVTALDGAGGLVGHVNSLYNESYVSLIDSFSAGSAVATENENQGGVIGYYAEGDVLVESENVHYDSAKNAQCSGGTALTPCSGVDTTVAPGYFKNNSTNAPLDTWNFATIWQTRSTTYPELTRFTDDNDGDGVVDDIEVGGPNSGDANSDGTPDVEQPFVSTYVNTASGKYVSVVVSNSCSLTTVDSQTEAAHGTKDSGYDYADGFIGFTAGCGTNGFSMNVSVYYYGITQGPLVLRKYNPTTNGYFTVAGATLSQQTIGGQTVTKASYTVVDGGNLDVDGVANGVIIDPVGLASAVAAAPNTGFGRLLY